MVGQHIFVRSKNEQGNAGTWTAAITDRVVDKDVVRNLIEPRCNMDEAFAQRALLTNTDNNILRLYHIGEGVTVASRTYWVTDRITDGRKGAYSISYILTGDDIINFYSDFGGAFDTNCFESYEQMVDRIGQGKVTINDTKSIFEHGIAEYDASVFDKVGFTKESFVLYMNGIYSALENKKQFAVILPAHIRSAWENSGDNTAEKLAYATLSLLPDFTRMHLGVASHWSCQIKDRMVSDMHLVFVHPDGENDYAYLKRESIPLLDLDGGVHTSNLNADFTEYFSFVWENRNNMSVIEEFWADTKSKYRKLLRGKPDSGHAIESLFLIKRVNDGGFGDKAVCRKAFLYAAEEFAGAGTKVPAAEEFLQTAMRTLDLRASSLDADMEKALSLLVSYDGEPTKHQPIAYDALLYSALETGTASEETVKVLCDEVKKEGRNSASFYISYLTEKKEAEADKITPQMTLFVAGVFANLCKIQQGPAEAELFRSAISVMQEWDIILSEAGRFDLLKAFVDAYAVFLASKSTNSEILGIAYKFLFKYEVSVPSQMREECSAILFKEEKRIYKLEYSDNQLRLYANAFFDNMPKITKLNKELALLLYQRLFRLAYKRDPQIVDGAMALYMDAVQTAAEDIEAEKILAILLKCQETTLAEISEAPAIWKRGDVGKVILMFELLNIKCMKRYVATEQRVSTLMSWYNKEDVNTYRVVKHYLQTLSAGDRQMIYNGMKQYDLLTNMFMHLRFAEKDTDYCGEIEAHIGKSHDELCTVIFTSLLLADSSYDAAVVNQNFGEWYAESLSRDVEYIASTDPNPFVAQNARIMQEMREVGKIRFAIPEFKNTVKETIDKLSLKVYSEADVNDVVVLPPETLREINHAIDRAGFGEELSNANMFKTLASFDDIALTGSLRSLDEVCGKAHGKDEGAWISRRIQHFITTPGSEERRKWYWLYYIMLNISRDGVFPMETYMQRIGVQDAPDDKIAEALMNIAAELHECRSSFENLYGIAMLRVIMPKIRENPQAFDRDSIRSAYKRFYNARYLGGSQELYQLLRRAMNKGGVRFDIKMFLMCILGAIVACGAMAGFYIVFTALGKLGTWMVLSVGILVFVCLAVLDICLMLSLRKKPRR